MLGVSADHPLARAGAGGDWKAGVLEWPKNGYVLRTHTEATSSRSFKELQGTWFFQAFLVKDSPC